jgi:hypothetical protein
MMSEKLNCLCRNETRLYEMVDASSWSFSHIVLTILENYYAVHNSHFYNSVIYKVNAFVFPIRCGPEFSASQLVFKHVPKKGSHEQRLSMSWFKFHFSPPPLESIASYETFKRFNINNFNIAEKKPNFEPSTLIKTFQQTEKIHNCTQLFIEIVQGC